MNGAAWLAGLSQQASLQAVRALVEHIPEQANRKGPDERAQSLPPSPPGGGWWLRQRPRLRLRCFSSMPARHGLLAALLRPLTGRPSCDPRLPAGWCRPVPLWPGRLKRGGPSNAPHHRGRHARELAGFEHKQALVLRSCSSRAASRGRACLAAVGMSRISSPTVLASTWCTLPVRSARGFAQIDQPHRAAIT